MRSLVIDVNHPAGAEWPPAEERLRLEELPVKRGLGLIWAVRSTAKHPRYGRVYIACKDHRHVGPWLLLAALSFSREVWVLPVTSSLHRLTKAGLFWKLPVVKRLLSRAAAREFVKAMRTNPPAGGPPKAGGVLLLSHSYPPSTGGIQTSMLHAAQGLAERGVGVRVLDGYRSGWRTYDAGSPVPVRRVYNGARFRLCEYRRLARRAAEATRLLPGKTPSPAVLDCVEMFIAACSPDKAAAFLSNYEAACRLTAEGAPDTIHVGYCHPDSMTAMLLSSIGGWPYLVYAHGTETLRFSQDRRLAPFLTKSLGAAAAVLANAGYCKDIIERGHGVRPERVEIIHPGVDCGRFSGLPPAAVLAELRRRYQVTPEDRVLFIVGRVVPLKGFDTVLAALPTVRRQFPRTILLLGGDGFDLPRIRRLVSELNLEEAVRVLGRVPDEELPALYHLADLFVMPSRDDPPGSFEGFGIVFLEAGAAGTPSVGGRSGGIPEAVLDGETGLLCDPWDPADLAEKIIGLFREPELLRKLGEGARRWAAEHDWERVIARKLALDERMRRRAAVGEWRPPA